MTNLSSGHDLQQVVSIHPVHQGDEESGRDSCKVATVEEGIGNAKIARSQTVVDNKEEPQENVDCLEAVTIERETSP